MKLRLLVENPGRMDWFVKTTGASLQVAEIVLNTDPTPKKLFSNFLTKLYKFGKIHVSGGIRTESPEIRLPEDSVRVSQVLNAFLKLKPKLPIELRDINRFGGFHELEDKLEELGIGAALGGKGVTVVPDGAKVIYKDRDGTVIFGIEHLLDDVDDDSKVEAVEQLGMGTRWCTRGDYDEDDGSLARHYLENGPIYIIYRSGKPVAQLWAGDSHGQFTYQFMDIRDRTINTSHFPELRGIIDELIDKASVEHVTLAMAKRKKSIHSLTVFKGNQGISLSDVVVYSQVHPEIAQYIKENERQVNDIIVRQIVLGSDSPDKVTVMVLKQLRDYIELENPNFTHKQYRLLSNSVPILMSKLATIIWKETKNIRIQSTMRKYEDMIERLKGDGKFIIDYLSGVDHEAEQYSREAS